MNVSLAHCWLLSIFVLMFIIKGKPLFDCKSVKTSQFKIKSENREAQPALLRSQNQSHIPLVQAVNRHLYSTPEAEGSYLYLNIIFDLLGCVPVNGSSQWRSQYITPDRNQ